MKRSKIFDAPMATLLIALAVGLAIAVHPVFLVLGFLVTIFVLIEAVARAMHEHAHRTAPIHQHP